MRRTARLKVGIAGALMVVRCQLAAEDAIPYNGIEQHEGKHKDPLAPEHERKS